MISEKIKAAIEASPMILKVIGDGGARNWSSFTRTTYERIARTINQEVTRNVLDSPAPVEDFLLFGQHEFENILFKYKLSGMSDFIEQLRQMNHQKPYMWISGKTLQAYWSKGNPKDKKLNVLLTFLNIKLQEWDEWKKRGHEKDMALSSRSDHLNNTLRILQQHFTGYYHRYYQKSDQSPFMIKAPFIIREDLEEIIVIETKTLGHQYKSSGMTIRNGALYLECENINWDEKESYIFNIGLETDPKVITGVSNTLNKKGQPIALKNVLVKQLTPFDFNSAIATEISFHGPHDPAAEEAKLISFLKDSGRNVIVSPCYSTLEELVGHADEIEHKI